MAFQALWKMISDPELAGREFRLGTRLVARQSACARRGRQYEFCGISCRRIDNVSLDNRKCGYGLVAKMSGEGPGDSSLRALVNPASASHPAISSNEYVSPLSVFTSILTAKNSAFKGPVRSGFTRNSAIAMVPPELSACRVFAKSTRLRSLPSL